MCLGFLAALPPPLASEEDANQRTEAGQTPSPWGLAPLFSVQLDLPPPGTAFLLALPHGHLGSQGTDQSPGQ